MIAILSEEKIIQEKAEFCFFNRQLNVETQKLEMENGVIITISENDLTRLIGVIEIPLRSFDPGHCLTKINKAENLFRLYGSSPAKGQKREQLCKEIQTALQY